jgi:integrase
MLGLGQWPDTSLAQARDDRDDARKVLARHIDPSAQRKAERNSVAHTFSAVAKELFEQQARTWDPATLKNARRRFEVYLQPFIGAKPIAQLTAPDALAVVRRIESKGIHETARRVRELGSRICRFAVVTGRAEHDVWAPLKGAITSPKVTNFASLRDPKRIGELLRAIDGYIGQPSAQYALKLAPYVFVRPGELRGAEWCEFDLDAEQPEWRIPGERMKRGEQHIVPLSTQAVAILRELQAINGGRLLFPSLRGADRSVSDNTLNAAMRRMGFAGTDMTCHGFRSTASTLLNEQGWHPDIIELQLAHQERNKVRAAYNRAQRLPERRKMMQAWANYLDGLRAGANVVPIRRPA